MLRTYKNALIVNKIAIKITKSDYDPESVTTLKNR